MKVSVPKIRLPRVRFPKVRLPKFKPPKPSELAVSVLLFVVGEAALLGGVAMWSVPMALILGGLQAIGLGLLRVTDNVPGGRQ